MTQVQESVGRSVVGKVISNKMNKTIVVEVERKVKHPLYGKYLRRFSRLYAHDNENTCRIGDTVLIKMCRPLSKTKSWMLVQVLEQAEQEVTEKK